ncbi:hypothetical protein P171DRAFT_246520 [Karstenula rhodostoma CBS 690.94]|uniref:Uncharacterized protein n=1 Tax=Karstenula rhodostoma CBS 690.94 TaxID=1392251 RepID=A0A9P4UE79_9PLEO|nr:hypothetical protein P171DRAFT_246520 [Karstenula rhodostoma CBS 690.94]
MKARSRPEQGANLRNQAETATEGLASCDSGTPTVRCSPGQGHCWHAHERVHIACPLIIRTVGHRARAKVGITQVRTNIAEIIVCYAYHATSMYVVSPATAWCWCRSKYPHIVAPRRTPIHVRNSPRGKTRSTQGPRLCNDRAYSGYTPIKETFIRSRLISSSLPGGPIAAT